MTNFFFTLVISFYAISLVDASKNNRSITVDLIHRDSPLSPLSNPNATQFERLQNMFDRSIARKASSSMSMEAPLVQSSIHGEYFIKISIGTPPIETYAIVDTGSDLLWVPCLPCTGECDANNFDPSKSTSYRGLPCESSQCHSLDDTSCDNENLCQYKSSYRDGSYSIGSLSNDIITILFPFRQSIVFGCGHESSGMNMGIMGLGFGDLSIVNQLQNSFSGMFSYCFSRVDDQSYPPGKLVFGSNALISGPQAVSTPLIKNSDPDDTNYYLHLEGITVGTNRLEFNQGNIMIDSGTMLTNFDKQFYQQLKSEIAKLIDGEPNPEPGQLCYNQTKIAPKIVFHFTDADLELPSTNTFLQQESKFCLTMASSDDRNIFGNLNQMNYLVAYDLVNNKVSFAPADCSKFP